MTTDATRVERLARALAEQPALERRVERLVALERRRRYWREVPATPDEARIIGHAWQLARRHGLRFAAGEVEIRVAANLQEVGLRGMADWRGLPGIAWVQAGLSPREMTHTLLHELVHLHDAKHDPRYDERTFEDIESRCHSVAHRIMLHESWIVPL